MQALRNGCSAITTSFVFIKFILHLREHYIFSVSVRPLFSVSLAVPTVVSSVPWPDPPSLESQVSLP